MRLLPPPFTDDLGRRVPAAVVTKDVLRFVDADWKRRRALPGLKQEKRRGEALLAMLGAPPILSAQILVYVRQPVPTVEGTLLFVMFVFACALMLRFLSPWLVGLVRPIRPAQTRQRFLAALLCPACAHDLKGAPPREDGVTVCPECGAAWRLEGAEARSHEGTKGSGG